MNRGTTNCAITETEFLDRDGWHASTLMETSGSRAGPLQSGRFRFLHVSNRRIQAQEFLVASEWYVARDGHRFGPMSPAQLKQMAGNRQLVHSDLLWKQAMQTWVPAATMRDLFGDAGGPHIAQP